MVVALVADLVAAAALAVVADLGAGVEVEADRVEEVEEADLLLAAARGEVVDLEAEAAGLPLGEMVVYHPPDLFVLDAGLDPADASGLLAAEAVEAGHLPGIPGRGVAISDPAEAAALAAVLAVLRDQECPGLRAGFWDPMGNGTT